MSDTNQLPFLRCPPRKIKINDKYSSEKIPAVLFYFNDILSIYSSSDDCEEDLDSNPDILIKKPNAIISMKDEETAVEIFTTACHPNVSYHRFITYNNKKYFEACLGDYVISSPSFNNHNILAGLVFRYLSEYNENGYNRPIESYIDNRFKCYFCKKNVAKPLHASDNIHAVSDIPKDFTVPCLMCCEKSVNITNPATLATLNNRTVVSIYDLFELDVNCRRIKYSKKYQEYMYND